MAIRITPANAGIYDQYVTIIFNSATLTDRDSDGGQLEDWGDLFDALASYQAEPSRAGGAEYNADTKRVVEDRAIFRLRYDAQTSQINEAFYRIRHNGKEWDIQRVYDPTGKHIEIHLEVHFIT
jgi:hypothetical protein